MASKLIYIVTPSEIKERTALHDNTDEKVILPEIKIVQDTIIMPMLGSTLFKKILSLIEADTINDSGNEWYLRLIDDYLADAISNFVLGEISTTLANQFYNKGVGGFRDDNFDKVSYQQQIQVKNKYTQQGEFYITECRKFIIQNQSHYAEFINPGGGIDVTTPNASTFTCSLYLGDENEFLEDRGYSDKNRGRTHPQNLNEYYNQR
jgi:hypothetical protein